MCVCVCVCGHECVCVHECACVCVRIPKVKRVWHVPLQVLGMAVC